MNVNEGRRGCRSVSISAAFFAANFWRTRSTDAAVAWFVNLSSMVAAV